MSVDVVEVWFSPPLLTKLELLVIVFKSGKSAKSPEVFGPLTMETMATERLTRRAYSISRPVKLSSIRMCRLGGEHKPGNEDEEEQ